LLLIAIITESPIQLGGGLQPGFFKGTCSLWCLLSLKEISGLLFSSLLIEILCFNPATCHIKASKQYHRIAAEMDCW
jgi:hypothetical protein